MTPGAMIRPEPSIRVMVLEDDTKSREALEQLLSSSPGFDCVGTSATGENALDSIPLVEPQVILVDLELPGMSGVEFLRLVRKRFPEIELLVLTVHDEADWLFPALAAGASGYVLKGVDRRRLLEAIAELKRGGAFMSSSIARRMLTVFRRISGQHVEFQELTPRESEVLSRLAQGMRYEEIASELGLSVRTVNTHLHRIYRKLHVTSATGAVAKFLQQQRGS